MIKLLLGGTAILQLLLLMQPAKSAVIADLGINPTSAQGDFSNSVGGAVFTDQYTFQLVGGPQFVSIASATNVFASPADFITGFTGQLFLQVGAVGGGDDIPNDVPFAAIPCPTSPTNCQGVAGSALLDPGTYYLELAGTGGGTSGYGGNLTTFAVPVGPMGGLPALMALGGLFGWRRFRRA